MNLEQNSKLKKVSGAVFDLDGTLVDSMDISYSGLNYGLNRIGMKSMTIEEFKPFMGASEAQILKGIAGEEKGSVAFSEFKTFLRENLEKVSLHEGVMELLEYLSSKKMPIGIFTGRGRETTDMILNHLGISSFFQTVVTSDDVTNPKPSAEGLLRSLSEMWLQPEHVLFVGDAPADMIAGQVAGTLNVAALWDFIGEEDYQERKDKLNSYHPYYWAQHPQEISKFFN